MEYRVLDSFDIGRCEEAVALHHRHLSYRSFIACFGPKFLLAVYRDILDSQLGFLVMAVKENKLRGFILACTDTGSLFGLIRKRFFKYCGLMLPQILKNPLLIAKTVETLFYSRNEKSPIAPELLVIVVDTEQRSQGTGGEMLRRMEQEFIRRDVRQYKVTVHEEMGRSNDFYADNGCALSGRFRMYGVQWNLYTKTI